MSKYRIYYSEISTGEIEVDADSIEDAKEEYYSELTNGNLSYSSEHQIDKIIEIKGD